jgi:hypothetical protein
MNKINRIQNFLYFHKKQVALGLLFCSAYGYTCQKARYWNNEAFRMGVAGSLAHMCVECGFHVIDTVNINAKANNAHVTTSSMV